MAAESWGELLEDADRKPLWKDSLFVTEGRPRIRMGWEVYSTRGGGGRMEIHYTTGADGEEDALDQLARGTATQVAAIMERPYTMQYMGVSQSRTIRGTEFMRAKTTVTVSEGRWLDPLMGMLQRMKQAGVGT